MWGWEIRMSMTLVFMDFHPTPNTRWKSFFQRVILYARLKFFDDEYGYFIDESGDVVSLQFYSVDLNTSTSLTITENQPVGTIVGEFNAIDPEGGAITYNFVEGENNNSFFTLDTNGLQDRHHF